MEDPRKRAVWSPLTCVTPRLPNEPRSRVRNEGIRRTALPLPVLEQERRSLPATGVSVSAADGCRWVMEIDDRPVATVEVVHEGQHTARIRSLKIDPAWYRSSILPRLIRCVQTYCREQGRRRLIVERGSAPGWIMAELGRQGVRSVAGNPPPEFFGTPASPIKTAPTRCGSPL